MPDVLSPRDLVSIPEYMDETLPHTTAQVVLFWVIISTNVEWMEASDQRYEPYQLSVGFGIRLLHQYQCRILYEYLT